MLTVAERKRRLPRGAVARVAERRGVHPSRVSRALNGERNERYEADLAKLMEPPTTPEEAFGPPRRILRKRRTKGATV